MSDPSQTISGAKLSEKADANRRIGKVKKIATFFCDALDASKDVGVIKAIIEATPWWLEATAEAAKQSFPLIKFAATLFEKWSEETDTQTIGLAVCTLAYQHCVEDAIKWTGAPEQAKPTATEVKDRIQSLEPKQPFDFTTFSLREALHHPFVQSAEEMLTTYLDAVGYTDASRRKITGFVRRRFVTNLRLILSEASLQKRFKPFLDLIQNGSELPAYDALMRHVQYQRWLFEEDKVFGKEPFTLNDVYIETECGHLTWGEIKGSAERGSEDGTRRKEAVDAFSEKFGGRQPLLDTVVSLLKSPGFHDAIIIQGAAGSGKSTFTLKLCADLEREGLYPIRIRLRDLSHSLDERLEEALAKALFPPDRELPPAFQGGAGDDPFRRDAIFREKVDYDGAAICPYVIILDGWDEINISAEEGFKVRVARLLDEVRAKFLKNTPTTIRVILTGRPSAAVAESRFLLNSTPILTIRPIQPQQLEGFVEDLRQALDAADPAARADAWTVPAADVLQTVFEKYTADFQAKIKRETKGENTDGESGSMDVLGLPLLAHLAIRLISKWQGKPEELTENPTTLYRCMVDLTCVKGGKAPDDQYEVEEGSFLTGSPLRALLQKTAAAMTTYGEESIPFRELGLRLNLEDAELNRQATEFSDSHLLASLMISFFFKGGHHNLGCEFLHKTFREYLFAETIVEALKRCGHDGRELQARGEYWKDFGEGTVLYDFSRAVSELFAPQWLSPEVVRHLEALLEWEIGRSGSDKSPLETGTGGMPTEPIAIAQWEKARDGLADLWDWWSEGTHLRPQPMRDQKTKDLKLGSAYVDKLIEHDLPYDPAQRKRRFAPARSVTMDAHLGDAIFRVASAVHFQLNKRLGWLDESRFEGGLTPAKLWQGVSSDGIASRRCQSVIRDGERSWLVFRPARADGRYFDFYKARINAAGWRPFGPFPSGMTMDGADLRNSNISIAFNSQNPDMVSRVTSWRYANLREAVGTLGIFVRCDFTLSFAQASTFEAAVFLEATLENANFTSARLNQSYFWNTTLSGAKLDHASFKDSRFEAADFTNAQLLSINLRNVSVDTSTRGIPKHVLDDAEAYIRTIP